MSNNYDVNTPNPINNFELMNDIHISMKDLRLLATTTLLQEKIKRNNDKKKLIKY